MEDQQPAELSLILERFRRASTASIATELFKHGLRNQVLADVRPVSTTVGFAAPAFTMRHIPAREDSTPSSRSGCPAICNGKPSSASNLARRSSSIAAETRALARAV